MRWMIWLPAMATLLLTLPTAAWATTECPPGTAGCAPAGQGWHAQLATAVGFIVTGGVLWWLGTVWPRRSPDGPIKINRTGYGERRYPDDPN
ncbi:hypothetical protein [Streptosporangium sp. KLBMP 9127]|nr:hypothetical protein [Streptosporangium sp. KLBMP 9127]